MKKLLLTNFLFQFSVFIFAQQAGIIDQSFANNGYAITHFTEGNAVGNAIVLQPDGKIVVGGIVSYGIAADFIAVRYNSNGSLDNTFGTNGKVIVAIGNGFNDLFSVLLQADGKIVLAGLTENATKDVALCRLNANGALDNSFGNGGKVVLDFDGADDKIIGANLQSDGKILVCGSMETGIGGDFLVIRFNNNGTVDHTFGVNGKFQFDTGSNVDQIDNLKLSADGKIIGVGSTADVNSGDVRDFAVIRLTDNGGLDNTFGVNGLVVTNVHDSLHTDFARVCQILPDGKIIVAGTTLASEYEDFAIVKYNTNGTIDQSFGVNGRVIADIDPEHHDWITSFILQPDGKIVVSGFSMGSSESSMIISRYNPNGSLDINFGNAGIVTINTTPVNYGFGLALQVDGKILSSGTELTQTNSSVMVVRLFSGLTMGVLDFNDNQSSLVAYPNPVSDFVHLQFSLKTQEKINIELYDVRGSKLSVLMEDVLVDGMFEQAIMLPSGLSSGTYYVSIVSPSGKKTVQVIK